MGVWAAVFMAVIALVVLHVRLPEDHAMQQVNVLDALRRKLHDAVPESVQPFSLDVVFTSDTRRMT